MDFAGLPFGLIVRGCCGGVPRVHSSLNLKSEFLAALHSSLSFVGRRLWTSVLRVFGTNDTGDGILR